MSDKPNKTIDYLVGLEKEAKEGKLHLALASAKLALDKAEESNIDIVIEVEDLLYEARKNYLPILYKDILESLHKLDSSNELYDDDVNAVKLKIQRLSRHAKLIGQQKHYRGRILELYEIVDAL